MRIWLHLSTCCLTITAAIAGSGAPAMAADKGGDSQQPKERVFRFDYGASIGGLTPGANVRVWIPVSRSDQHQEIETLKSGLPAASTLGRDATYRNRMLYFAVKAPESGEVRFSRSYRIRRREVLGLTGNQQDAGLSSAQRKLFLAANSSVPIDGKPVALLKGLDLPGQRLQLGRLLYDRVDEHVRYDKSKPGYGRGDSAWVCDSRFGNCSDFHSLFISLARSQGVPARFEIGFPLPPERGAGRIGGYHCWAWFHVDGRGWLPVDISEADKHPELKNYYYGNLTENRVAFTTGRDITLARKQKSDPLNSTRRSGRRCLAAGEDSARLRLPGRRVEIGYAVDGRSSPPGSNLTQPGHGNWTFAILWLLVLYSSSERAYGGCWVRCFPPLEWSRRHESTILAGSLVRDVPDCLGRN